MVGLKNTRIRVFLSFPEILENCNIIQDRLYESDFDKEMKKLETKNPQ